MMFGSKTGPEIDGQEVRVRFLSHDDISEFESGFACLSKKTLLFRFLGGIRRLSRNQLEYLTNTDQKNHVALCSFILQDGVERGLGVARYVREPNDPCAAEFALLVIDPYQNRGVGQHLMQHLIAHARMNGVALFRGHVRDDNDSMLRIIQKNGGRTERRVGNVFVMKVPLNNEAPPNQAL